MLERNRPSKSKTGIDSILSLSLFYITLMLLKKKQSTKSLGRVFKYRKDDDPVPDLPIQISPPIPPRQPVKPTLDPNLDKTARRRSRSLTSLSPSDADQPWRSREAWAAIHTRQVIAPEPTTPVRVSPTQLGAGWRHRGGGAFFGGGGGGGGEERVIKSPSRGTAEERVIKGSIKGTDTGYGLGTGAGSGHGHGHGLTRSASGHDHVRGVRTDEVDLHVSARERPPGAATLLYRLKSQRAKQHDSQIDHPLSIATPATTSTCNSTSTSTTNSTTISSSNTTSSSSTNSSTSHTHLPTTSSTPSHSLSSSTSPSPVGEDPTPLLPPLLPSLNQSSSFTSLREHPSIAWGRRPSTPKIELPRSPTPTTPPSLSQSQSRVDSSVTQREREKSISPTPPPKTPGHHYQLENPILEIRHIPNIQTSQDMHEEQQELEEKHGKQDKQDEQDKQDKQDKQEEQDLVNGDKAKLLVQGRSLIKKRSWLERGSTEGHGDSRTRRGGWI
ncbi:hypothetical protein BCR39DRAFT_235119 [Naematelia encephala]|uniref:Uncharacterized protein n=1 Tax=Naematelia encephala TaxID=71784 RepID=A0A1Y2BGY6_9TREE|nr:hypothetical protein BCR39DRAFT_235119 [Naematelia encephala]